MRRYLFELALHQDTETVNLTDTLNEEKILGATTLVMSQNNNAAVDAAQEDLQDDAQEAGRYVTDYFAAVRLSRQQSRDSAVDHAAGSHGLWGGGGDASSASAELEEIVSTALCEAQMRAW